MNSVSASSNGLLCHAAYIWLGSKAALLGTWAGLFLYSYHGAASSSTTVQPVGVIETMTCDFETVRSAGGSARVGQTVLLATGDCDWRGNQLTVPAGISLIGRGRDSTVLRRTVGVSPARYLVRFDCRNRQKAVFSDISLVGANLATSDDRGLGLLYGCVDFIVANSRFSRFVFSGVEVRGPARQRGLIYNSEFLDNYSPARRNLSYGIVVFGDGTWPELDLGSKNAVFVEGSYFLGNRHHISSNNGARYEDRVLGNLVKLFK